MGLLAEFLLKQSTDPRPYFIKEEIKDVEKELE